MSSEVTFSKIYAPLAVAAIGSVGAGFLLAKKHPFSALASGIIATIGANTAFQKTVSFEGEKIGKKITEILTQLETLNKKIEEDEIAIRELDSQINQEEIFSITRRVQENRGAREGKIHELRKIFTERLQCPGIEALLLDDSDSEPSIDP